MYVRRLRSYLRLVSAPACGLAGAFLTMGCEGLDDSDDDLVFSEREAELDGSIIEGAYGRWLDLRKQGSTSTLGDDVFAVHNASPRLEYLGSGWWGDPVTQTIGGDYRHLDATGNLRRTTVIGGPKGETALVSSRLDGASHVPVIVTRDPEGKIEIPLLLIGPDQEDDAKCLEEAAEAGSFDDILDCLGLLDRSGGDGGSGAGGLFAPGYLGLGEPDCSSGDLVTDPHNAPETPQPPPTFAHIVGTLRYLNHFRDHPPVPLTDAYRAAAENLREAAAAFDGAQTAAQASPKDKELQQARDDAAREFHEAEAEYLKAERKLLDQAPGSEPLPGYPMNPKDPRCEGRETDSARGTLFSNGDFCKSGDFLTCLAEEQDSIRRITDGKCATVESPVGGTMLRCNDEGGDPLEVSPQGEETYPSDDPLEWTDPTSPPTHQGKIQARFADTFDLGHVLLGLCAAGGCPDDPRTP